MSLPSKKTSFGAARTNKHTHDPHLPALTAPCRGGRKHPHVMRGTTQNWPLGRHVPESKCQGDRLLFLSPWDSLKGSSWPSVGRSKNRRQDWPAAGVRHKPPLRPEDSNGLWGERLRTCSQGRSWGLLHLLPSPSPVSCTCFHGLASLECSSLRAGVCFFVSCFSHEAIA